ncbi:uncharacterized protein LOC143152573 [Ptiloglossa arizonensis]|uniref:uncharacterized protein LOC143152573 n=1 Tax=Ptiloglossa arizonensis TaxID=3350558 RepID=UPI003FA116C4
MFSMAAVVCALLLVSGNDADSVTSTAKSKTADLEGMASGYAYGQQQGLPVYYVRYTNHVSGRHYRAPDTAVQYVVGAVTPVARAAPATASFLLPYASADVSQGAKQLPLKAVDRVQHVDVHFEKPRAPYYTSGKINAKEVPLLRPYPTLDVSQGSKQIDSEIGGRGGSVQRANEHFEKPRAPYYVPGEISSKQVPRTLPYADVSYASEQLHGGTGDRGDQGSVHHANVPIEELHAGEKQLHGSTDRKGPVQHVSSEEPRAPYYVPGKITVNEVPIRLDKDDGTRNTVVEDHQDDESDDSNEDREQEDEYSDEEIHGGDHPERTKFNDSYDAKGESQGDGSSSFEVGGGENHVSEEHSQHGKKGNKGYKKYKEFSEGEHSGLDNESQRGYHSEESKGDKGHADEAEEYGSREEADSGEVGNDWGHSSYSKKGQKTNGFRNVYSKDEYKKVTDFYDDDHKKGHFVKYGDFDEGYKAVEGDFEKAGHRSSGNEHWDRGKKGYHDKGHRETQDQGRATVEDEKSYRENRANYDAEEDYKRDEARSYRKDSDRR